MISVEEIDLAAIGVKIPESKIGFVVAQPFLDLNDVEPYVWKPGSRATQVQFVLNAFEIAKQRLHGADRTDFLILPEYSVPGLHGINVVKAQLASADWPAGAMVIAGVDGLSATDFAQLCNAPNTVSSIDPKDVGADWWVNCCLVLVKDAAGVVFCWVQAKLAPAWDEQDATQAVMYQGQKVFIFGGLRGEYTRFRFSSLVCFDWAARVAGKAPWEWILHHLSETRKPDLICLDWIFVTENNPKPSHDVFLVDAVSFFDSTKYTNVIRSGASIVFANAAGEPRPGPVKGYGQSSIVFSGAAQYAQPTCLPTYSTNPRKLRKSTILNPLKQALFRESGACIHSFSYIHPLTVQGGPNQRQFPLDRAFVLPAQPGSDDPRTPSGPVFAIVKWINDQLDGFDDISTRKNCPLETRAEIQASHSQVVSVLRTLPAPSASKFLELAVPGISDDVDDWSEAPCQGLDTLVSAVSVLGATFGNGVRGTSGEHVVFKGPSDSIHVSVVTGTTHEDCLGHYLRFGIAPAGRALLISKDADNSSWIKAFGNILDQGQSNQDSPRFTDPKSAFRQVSYIEVLNSVKQTTTVEKLKEAVNGLAA